MKLLPLLFVRSIREKDAKETLLDELWQLRCRLIHVHSSVAPAADKAAFHSFFKQGDARISLLLDLQGKIRGFLGWYMRLLETENHRTAIVDSDYYFIEPELRGHFAMVQFALICFLQPALRYRCSRTVVVGHGYPSSVLSAARLSDRVCFLHDNDLKSWEHDAMVSFGTRFCSDTFDPSTGIIKMRTRPIEKRREPRTEKATAILRRFESQNPDWENGFGLPYLVHYSVSGLLRGVGRFAMG